MTWQQALDYVAGLNSSAYLGYTDWRLPNFNELTSIIDWGRSGPSLPVNNPFINVKQGVSERYWSSTSYGSFTALLWSFNTWTISHEYKLRNYNLWPIRSGEGGIIQLPKTGQTLSYAIGDDGDLEIGLVWPSQRFTDNGDGTVTDNLTGLVWTKDANLPGSAMTWQQALDYVVALNSSAYLGYTDWRLPNINELKSLIDRGRLFPSLPSNHPFINVQNYVYWSATTATFGNYSSTNEALTIYVGSDGNLVANNKPENYYVWPVRSGQVFKLPDTGQTQSYTDTFGEDSDYTINPPSYSDNGNGTVTDNVTGLMWQKEDDNQTYNWYEASGTYNATYNPGSTDVCGSLSLAGYSDWRLPSKKELITIVNYGTYDPAIDNTYFLNINASLHWSSTTYDATNPSGAWNVNFNDGSVYNYDQPLNLYVLCVRGGQYPTQSFTDNRNGTVTDSTTRLMWQQGEGGSKVWESALTYCEGLSLASYSDWRLPNIKELESITDDTRYGPAIDTIYFPNVNNENYWSSTTYAYTASFAWVVSFSYGHVYGLRYKTLYNYYVRCVRGGQSGLFGNLDHFEFLNISSPQAVGVPFSMTITARDEYGGVVDWDDEVILYASIGRISPTKAYLTDGSATLSVTLDSAGNNIKIQANGSGKSGESNYFNVTGAVADTGYMGGIVTDSNRNRLTGATVYLDDSVNYFEQTTNDGNYQFENIPCGEYRIWASYNGYNSREFKVKVLCGASDTKDLIVLGQVCNPTNLTPILLVPGIMGSSTGNGGIYPTLPAYSPEWKSSVWDTNSWGLHDPLGFAGWRKLVDVITSDEVEPNYVVGCNIFPVPYDWRVDADEAAQKYLKKWIDEAKSIAGADKVNIIAHSMGGLVTRAYIQSSNYQNDIDKFAMVGTPNHGAASAYFIPITIKKQGKLRKGLDFFT